MIQTGTSSKSRLRATESTASCWTSGLSRLKIRVAGFARLWDFTCMRLNSGESSYRIYPKSELQWNTRSSCSRRTANWMSMSRRKDRAIRTRPGIGCRHSGGVPFLPRDCKGSGRLLSVVPAICQSRQRPNSGSGSSMNSVSNTFRTPTAASRSILAATPKQTTFFRLSKAGITSCAYIDRERKSSRANGSFRRLSR